jgi:geranylgeranyl diphosphate synthase type I
MTRPGSDFALFVARVRETVEERLTVVLDRRLATARGRGADVEAAARALGQLTLRGGKRMRCVLLAAAYEAHGGEGGIEAVAPACVAIELLQAYLLVHDDWMDGDDVRRGGPSVPALMRKRFSGSAAMADAMTVLAGDLAAAWARRALFDLALPASRVVLAAAELARVEEDVVEGQMLDVVGGAHDLPDVEAMHVLKTSSYSVRGPVVMGARLAGATDVQVTALAAFADPLGVAFQMRDDVLGVFGAPTVMGKPAGSDLRAGKRSAVVVEALAQGLGGTLAPVLGRPQASESDVRAAIDRLESSGIRARLEARIGALVREAQGALERASLTPAGRALLSTAVLALTDRQS